MLKNLKTTSNFKCRGYLPVEEEIIKVFNFEKDFFSILLEKKLEIEDSPSEISPFQEIDYQIIFNNHAQNFLEDSNIKDIIKNYIEKYETLIEDSPYLNQTFQFHHAQVIQKQLAENKFYDAGHSINLFDGSSKLEFESNADFERALQEERDKIFNSAELKSTFENFDSKITNDAQRKLIGYLRNNPEIIPELADMSNFARKIWISYFAKHASLLNDLIEKYNNGRKEIESLTEKAKEERTDWEEVVEIFNKRFIHFPLTVSIANKEDVLLKDDVATIKFTFKDGEDEASFKEEKELLGWLSAGEKRALYILNIIFEIEARKKEDGETLIIIDDIADSFDYKNKYAIIEYLKYMSDEDKFFMFILTHNFDFFRTILSRGITVYNQCLIALKTDNETTLEKMDGVRNPFIKDWKSNLQDNKKLIASIPFVRNIIEYTQGESNDDYMLLTSALHCKSSTDDLTLEIIRDVFERHLKGINFPEKNLSKKLVELIFETADSCLDAPQGPNLENKIVLSIAIRLQAERFMIADINDKEFTDKITKGQYWTLLKRFEEMFNNKRKEIALLRSINLITPANIHVNSFMYEPILDIGDEEIRQLYREVSDLQSAT